MINYRMKLISLLVLFILFSCNNVNSQNIKIDESNESNIVDSVKLSLSSDYYLVINKYQKDSQRINFFESVINELQKEKMYVQILYDKKNIIINLEIGENANLYEDYYLSKKIPIIIEKIIRTTIDKTNPMIKSECEKILNIPLSSDSRYKKVSNDTMKCNDIIQN